MSRLASSKGIHLVPIGTQLFLVANMIWNSEISHWKWADIFSGDNRASRDGLVLNTFQRKWQQVKLTFACLHRTGYFKAILQFLHGLSTKTSGPFLLLLLSVDFKRQKGRCCCIDITRNVGWIHGFTGTGKVDRWEGKIKRTSTTTFRIKISREGNHKRRPRQPIVLALTESFSTNSGRDDDRRRCIHSCRCTICRIFHLRSSHFRCHHRENRNREAKRHRRRRCAIWLDRFRHEPEGIRISMQRDQDEESMANHSPRSGC